MKNTTRYCKQNESSFFMVIHKAFFGVCDSFMKKTNKIIREISGIPEISSIVYDS